MKIGVKVPQWRARGFSRVGMDSFLLTIHMSIWVSCTVQSEYL